jgi:hypothetical protein
VACLCRWRCQNKEPLKPQKLKPMLAQQVIVASGAIKSLRTLLPVKRLCFGPVSNRGDGVSELRTMRQLPCAMLALVTLLFAVSLARLAVAPADANSITQDKIALYRTHCSTAKAPSVGRRLIAQVLCCCKTHSGGECCTRVAQCGRELPGCFCASPSVPGVRNLSSLAQPY